MSQRNPKTEGMAWLNPYIIVKDIKSSLEFYEKAFGFQTTMTMPDKDGSIMHAEMKYKDMTIMMGSESDEQDAKSPGTLDGSPVTFYVYVEDIAKHFEKAKAAGAAVKAELTDQFWGDRTCSFRCPEGHRWTFAQNVADFDPANVPK